jgi:hypothetical protein
LKKVSHLGRVRSAFLDIHVLEAFTVFHQVPSSGWVWVLKYIKVR